MSSPSKKKVLIITYYWPPSGGSAVQRWLSFSNHLVKLGFEVFVLTVSEETATYPLWDESLVQKIDPNIHVSRSDTKGVFSIYKKYIGKGQVPSAGFANEGKPNFLQLTARFVRGNFFLPDARKSWNKTAIPKALELIDQHQIDTVITAGPPHSSHLIGKKIKKERSSIYWIADFHDAWTDVWYYDKLFKTKPIISIDKAMEKSILQQADHVLVVGEYLKNVLAQKIAGHEQKFSVISMGYDDPIDQMKMQQANADFTITYTGTIDVDYRPEILIDALKKLNSENPTCRIKLKFVGLLSSAIREKIVAEGLEAMLIETGYVSHQESIEHLVSADCLLLISPEVKSEKFIIPGKLYEYLATQKPIINIGHLETDTARIVSLCDAGRNFNREQTAALQEYIQQLYTAWGKGGDESIDKNRNTVFKDYRRSQEAAKIALLLEKKPV